VRFTPALIPLPDPAFTMKASERYVGASGDVVALDGQVNEMTITFKPKTRLDPKNGKVRIYTPPNFNSLKKPMYPHHESKF